MLLGITDAVATPVLVTLVTLLCAAMGALYRDNRRLSREKEQDLVNVQRTLVPVLERIGTVLNELGAQVGRSTRRMAQNAEMIEAWINDGVYIQAETTSPEGAPSASTSSEPDTGTSTHGR